MKKQTRKQSQLAGTSAKAMLVARRHYHLRFASGFAYAPFNATVTKISKWSRIQDSCRITPKIESLVVYAMPDIPSKFQKDPFITFWVILYTHRQTNRQTDKVRQKHYLLGGGNKEMNKQSETQRQRNKETDTERNLASLEYWAVTDCCWCLHTTSVRTNLQHSMHTHYTVFSGVQKFCSMTSVNQAINQ